MTKYGYARVSTTGQASKGNSLEDQKNLLIAAGVSEKNIYFDSFTGTKMDRPKFDVLMAELKPGDEFVVTKMDRFARNAPEGIQTVRDLVDKGIAVHILNMGRADNTPTGKLLVTILLAFAEFERDMIVERTMAGKSYAKEHNPEFKEGRPRKNVVYELAEGESISAACRRLGISRTQWYRIMKKAG